MIKKEVEWTGNYYSKGSMIGVANALESVLFIEHHQSILEQGLSNIIKGKKFSLLKLLFDLFEATDLLKTLRDRLD